MKVKELIEQLEKLNPELNVVIKGYDPTNYIYYNNIKGDVKENKVCLDENDKIFKKVKVVVINGGMF